MNPTLYWKDHALYLLDQRLLPHQLDYLRCGTWQEVARSIEEMVVRGAPAIGVAAAFGVALAALPDGGPGDVTGRVAEAIEGIGRARPTARNLFWALERMRHLSERESGNDHLAALLLEEAHRMLKEDIEVNRRIGENGQELIPDPARVLTHCNAGALATAGFGTALGVIRAAVLRGKRIEVLAGETRPLFQGARITSWELSQEGIPVTVIPDNAVGFLMSRGEVDVVVVGADRIAANGDTANKIGTYSIAVLARIHRIPFYVAAPTSTIDVTISSGSGIHIEERRGEEVAICGGTRIVPRGVRVRNPAFDVTPEEYLSAIITERGVIRPPLSEGIRGLALA